MLEVKGVYKTFNPGTINEKKALNGIDLTLNEGDFVTVIGGNGAGKSTILNMITGVYPVDSGKIIIDGVEALNGAMHTIIPDRIAAATYMAAAAAGSLRGKGAGLCLHPAASAGTAPEKREKSLKIRISYEKALTIKAFSCILIERSEDSRW